MTPAERAVIDAARALVPVVEHLIASLDADGYGYRVAGENALRSLEAAAPAFLTAVRALPRPLSEQLAELRPGAVVELGLGERTVLANFPEHECFVAAKAVGLTIYRYCSVTRIISNPEAA